MQSIPPTTANKQTQAQKKSLIGGGRGWIVDGGGRAGGEGRGGTVWEERRTGTGWRRRGGGEGEEGDLMEVEGGRGMCEWHGVRELSR